MIAGISSHGLRKGEKRRKIGFTVFLSFLPFPAFYGKFYGKKSFLFPRFFSEWRSKEKQRKPKRVVLICSLVKRDIPC